jgi:AcrR family transcriptional regulator
MRKASHQTTKRFDKKSWLTLGLEHLSKQSNEQITIEILCKNADKTKGSFYFHFKNIDVYLERLTQYWFEEYTQKITQKPIQNMQRLDLLNQLVGRLDLNLEVGIRNLALKNETVQKTVRKADRYRIKWLSTLYVNTGKYEEAQAEALATIEIAAFTGFKLINPDMKPAEARNLYESFLKLTNRV